MHVDREVGRRRRRLEAVEHLVDVALHLAGGLVAVGRVLLQRLHHDRVDLRRDLVVVLRRRRDARLAYLLEDGELVVAGEELAPGEELEEHRGQREDVGAFVDGPAPGLLRRHVLQLSLERAGLRVRRLRRRLGDAEVAELDVAFLGDEHVLRGDVAMHEAHLFVFEVAFAVRVIERRGNLRGDEKRDLDRQRLIAFLRFLEDVLQIVPIDVLHGDVVRALDFAEVVDVDDVVVIELGGQLRFIDEHLDEVLIVGKVRQDFLDGDDLLKSFDAAHARFPDLGHAAGGDLFEEDVLSELDAIGRLFFLRMRSGNGGGKDRLRDRHPIELGDLDANGFVGGGGLRRRRRGTRRGGRRSGNRRDDGRRRNVSGRRDAPRIFLETGERVLETLVERG